jgi:hypothetical protein
MQSGQKGRKNCVMNSREKAGDLAVQHPTKYELALREGIQMTRDIA